MLDMRGKKWTKTKSVDQQLSIYIINKLRLPTAPTLALCQKGKSSICGTFTELGGPFFPSICFLQNLADIASHT